VPIRPILPAGEIRAGYASGREHRVPTTGAKFALASVRSAELGVTPGSEIGSAGNRFLSPVARPEQGTTSHFSGAKTETPATVHARRLPVICAAHFQRSFSRSIDSENEHRRRVISG